MITNCPHGKVFEDGLKPSCQTPLYDPVDEARDFELEDEITFEPTPEDLGAYNL